MQLPDCPHRPLQPEFVHGCGSPSVRLGDLYLPQESLHDLGVLQWYRMAREPQKHGGPLGQKDFDVYQPREHPDVQLAVRNAEGYEHVRLAQGKHDPNMRRLCSSFVNATQVYVPWPQPFSQVSVAAQRISSEKGVQHNDTYGVFFRFECMRISVCRFGWWGF